MSTFLYRLGRWCFRHGGRVLAGWLLVLAVTGGAAFGLMGKFDNAFTLPGTQSQVALDQLRMTFPEMAGTSATMVVVAPPGETLDDPPVRAAVEATVTRIGKLDFIASAQSPYFELTDGMISADRRAGLASLMLDGSLTDFTDPQKAALIGEAEQLQAALPGATVRMGGEAFNATIPSLGLVEALGVGVAVVVLVLVMGSLVAASMPLVTALVGVLISMALILAATGLTTVNSTTPMLALMLGLAVGIDYALFILSRHREQLGEGMDVEESAARAVATSGSAVIFAGMTVFIALVGLSVAQIPFLTTMGIAASLGIAVAVAVALTLVPAMAGLAGERLRPRARRRLGRGLGRGPDRHEAATDRHEAARLRMQAVAAGRGGGMAGWWVRTVTRRPVLTIVVVVVALGALALPARDMQLALPNAGQNKVGTSSREAYDLIAREFGPGYNGSLVVTAQIIGSTDPLGVMAGLRKDIEAMPGVQLVVIATPNRTADTGIVQVIPTTGPDDPTTNALVERLRAAAPGWQDRYGVQTAVTGYTAVAIDVSQRLGAALVPFGIFVVGMSLVLLTMVFRSIVVPIKATVGYLLSVLACFGATTLVFTHGVGAHLVNVEILGPVISFLPIITMGILFGLSMDYEVFLVSRMREDHVHGTPARAAVHTGFVGSSIVVLAAAVIMVAVFAFFVPESDRGSMQPIAFALTVGVAIDAFIVRMTLVPAVMSLLGERAWWLPRWLDRALPEFDVEGAALAEELALRDWPAGPPVALAAERLVAGDQERALHAPVDLRVPPGGRLLVTGEPAQRTALLLCLAGRLPAAEGKGRVAGQLLEHAGRVRRRVSVLDLRRTPAAIDELVRLGEEPGDPLHVVIVDNADAAADLRTRELLVTLVRESRSTVVVGALDERGLVPILPFATPRLKVRSLAPRPDPRPESRLGPWFDPGAQPDSMPDVGLDLLDPPTDRPTIQVGDPR
ncbi:putative drug exporter of the RND superfamily [Raineyella antarctica]|uniref:Putative drug exporter of the RND superfamily n=1 Tax=Raineyella antarctica TaxID=1577474 RepID=A0A1G6HDW3_9ACTN|nr:MMPL family transporter [Raineyella antarctica]SDB92278.1 putative drug exporter of the RND superfamily [Raineyella antarctica]